MYGGEGGRERDILVFPISVSNPELHNNIMQHFLGHLAVIPTFEIGIRPTRNENGYITTLLA